MTTWSWRYRQELEQRYIAADARAKKLYELLDNLDLDLDGSPTSEWMDKREKALAECKS